MAYFQVENAILFSQSHLVRICYFWGLTRTQKLVCLKLQEDICKAKLLQTPEKFLICSWDDGSTACVIQSLSATPLYACIYMYSTLHCRVSQCAHLKMTCEKVQYIEMARACCYLNTPLVSQIIKPHTGTSLVVLEVCWCEKRTTINLQILGFFCEKFGI